ncbi:UNVERIFIED_CONTAM: hypothetical protein RMT77_002505 [Armadillidium vulgare]
MFGEICCCTLLYVLFSLVIIFPPQEAISSGITIENLMNFWLGSESHSFIYYQIKRTVVTLIGHCLLLPGYVTTIFFLYPSLIEILNSSYHPWCVQIIAAVSLFPLFVTSFVVLNWRKGGWKNHPLAQTIALYISPEKSLLSLTEEINNECFRIDKVSSDINSISRIIATENWLIKITSYKIHLIALRDALLVIESTQEAPIIPNSTSPAQLISIRVTSLKESVKGFTFKVNSSIWGDLEKKLVNPVVNTKHLVIHQTLADRFVAVFEEAVQKNPKVKLQTEQESCIGCMGVKANIVLDRRCLTVNDKSSCRQCSCKPMWCLTCLGKWFAARQDPNETETWLSSSAPCPTCRSKFCLLDVFLIEE